MNTDRTFDPAQQGDMNATRRINVGPSTVRPASSTIRPASATIRSSAMMGGSTRPNGFASQDDNVDDQFFLLKGNKYKNLQSLSADTGEAQVFLVERDGEKYVLKIYYPNFDVNKKVLQTVYNFNFEMIVKVFDFGKTYVDGKHRYYELMEYLKGGTMQEYRLNGDMDKFRRIALQVLLRWPTVIRVISYIRISSLATSSSEIRNIQNWCLVTLVSPVSWIRTEKPTRRRRPVRRSMRHQRCTPM